MSGHDQERLIRLVLSGDDPGATAALERLASRHSDPLLWVVAGASKGWTWPQLATQCALVEPNRWTEPLLDSLRALLNQNALRRSAPLDWIEALTCGHYIPALSLVTSARLGPDCADWTSQACARFFQAPALNALSSLHIQTDRPAPALVAAMVMSGWIANLTVLSWHHNPEAPPSSLSDEAGERLLARPWRQLRSLTLRGHRLANRTAAALAANPQLCALAQLDLRHNPIPTEGLHALVMSPLSTQAASLDLPQGAALAQALSKAPLPWSALRKHLPLLRPQDAAPNLDARLLHNLPELLDDFTHDRDRRAASVAIQRLSPWWSSQVEALRLDPKARTRVAQKLPFALAATQTEDERIQLTGLALRLPLNTHDQALLWIASLNTLTQSSDRLAPYGWSASALAQALVGLPLVGDWALKRRDCLRIATRWPDADAGRVALSALRAARQWDAACAEGVLRAAIEAGAPCRYLDLCITAFQLDAEAALRLAEVALRVQKHEAHLTWAQSWALRHGDPAMRRRVLLLRLDAALRAQTPAELEVAVANALAPIGPPTESLPTTEHDASLSPFKTLIGQPLGRAVRALIAAAHTRVEALDALCAHGEPLDACTLYALSHWMTGPLWSRLAPEGALIQAAVQCLSLICDQHPPALYLPFLRALSASTPNKSLRRAAVKRLMASPTPPKTSKKC